MSAVELLKDLDNDYVKKLSYSHSVENRKFEDEYIHGILEHYEASIDECITQECKQYKVKIEHEIAHIQTLPHLTDLDKEVWIKNIKIMKKYKIQRAINKMYYMHCIQDIVKIIHHKNIKLISVPFNKNFFHVLNTVKGALITGKRSLDAKIIEELDKNNTMVAKLIIRN